VNETPLPPWLARPDIPHGSIGWRMGAGEDVYDAFYQWFSRLTDEEAAMFAESNPEPATWQGHYAMIRAHPWK
jgi:hypothetical protein